MNLLLILIALIWLLSGTNGLNPPNGSRTAPVRQLKLHLHSAYRLVYPVSNKLLALAILQDNVAKADTSSLEREFLLYSAHLGTSKCSIQVHGLYSTRR
jgi:hypothetical protein